MARRKPWLDEVLTQLNGGTLERCGSDATMVVMREPALRCGLRGSPRKSKVLSSHERSESCSACRVRIYIVPTPKGSCGAGRVWPNSQNGSKQGV